MTREKPDYKYEKKGEDETGILEIVGINEHCLEVLNAFANNYFA